MLLGVLSVSALSVSADGGTPWSNAAGWAVPELQTAVSDGLYPDALRGADLTQPVTRAEFAAVAVKLYETLGSTTAPISPSGTFTDTQDLNVLKACALGITDGVGGGLFAPDASITREAAATMLTRVYKALNWEGWTLADNADYTAHLLDTRDVTPFADVAAISTWARASVSFMSKYGIVNGIGGNAFSPQGTSTRQEAIIIANRLYTAINAGKIDYTIAWADPEFEALIRQALNKPTGVIWRSDLDSVTMLSINANHMYINSNRDTSMFDDETGDIARMDDILNFANLDVLWLKNNQVTQIPADMPKMQTLTYLDLSGNKINDISNLSGLNNLDFLRLDRNQINKIPPLNLPKLTNLNIDWNNISDLSALSGLKNLDALALEHNMVSDLTPLSGLGYLQLLHLSGNQITNLTPLSTLTYLQQLYLSDNKISDLTPLAGLSRLKYLYLDANRITDIRPLSGLMNLEIADLSGNSVTDWSPVADVPTVYGRP